MLPSLADHIIQQMELDYNQIADHFSATRQAPWPEFELLVDVINGRGVGAIHELPLLDVGCGNGRLLEAIPAVHYTGLDLSSQLLTRAQQRWPQHTFVHGSVLQLPFADAQFDIVTCIATLQHVPSLAYRQQAMRELARVLKPGGTLFMLNWNLQAQPQYQQYRASAKDGYDEHDYLIPWKDDQGTVLAHRYYHGFELQELLELLEIAGLTVIKNEVGENHRNIVTVMRSHFRG